MNDLSDFNHAQQHHQQMLNETMWSRTLEQPATPFGSQPARGRLRQRFANFLIRWGTYLKRREPITAVSPPTIAHHQ